MSLTVTIIIFIVILLVLVVVHEFGHFLVAKLFGIRVDEFGVGFPPKIAGKKFGETEYTVNWLPIGGFVRIFGEDPSVGPDETEEDQKRKFSKKPLYVQAAVIIAGVVMNFILAWVLFSAIFMIGVPATVGSAPDGTTLGNPHLAIVQVLPDSPAKKAGLEPGDALLGVSSGEEHLKHITGDQFQSFVESHGDKPVSVTYRRGDQKNTVTLTPELGVSQKEKSTPMIGVAFSTIGTYSLPPARAAWHGLKRTAYVAKMTIVGLATFFSHAAQGHPNLNAVAGPVGIVSILGTETALGFSHVLGFAAIISISLAVINIIPFPALDGGRLLFIILEAIKGSPFKPKVLNMVNAAGFAILILLMIAVTYHDILRIVT